MEGLAASAACRADSATRLRQALGQVFTHRQPELATEPPPYVIYGSLHLEISFRSCVTEAWISFRRG